MSGFGAAARWLWGSSFAASIGSGLERTATAWLALDAGGGAAAVGVVAAARMLPSLLLGLAAGTIADRVNRRTQLVAVGVASVPLMILTSWLVASGVQIWQVVAISFAAGTLNVFDIPARQALVIDAVPTERATNAIALNALAARLGVAIGGLAAGLLIATRGSAACYLFVAVVTTVGALLASRVNAPRAAHVVAAVPFGRALRDAARLVVDVPAVRLLLGAGIACEVFGFSHPTAFPVLARDVFRAGPEGLGLLNAGIGAGGTLSVIALAVLPARVRREPLLGAVFVVYGLGLLGLASAPSLLVAVGVTLVIGACAGAFDLLQQTLLQLAVPHEQRGRAMGLWVLGLGSAPLGHLEMGALVSAVGAPSALLVNGALVVTAAAGLLVRAPRYAPGRRSRT
ncbi:MAG TPA: MFS transporter [Chloroflexota bacterium]